MRNTSGLWRGGPGRPAGTRNKSTARIKTFLDAVFEEAFARPEMRAALVDQIATLTIDPRLLATLLGYYAGRPSMAVDHRVEGSLTLAELIVGATPDTKDVERDEPRGESSVNATW